MAKENVGEPEEGFYPIAEWAKRLNRQSAHAHRLCKEAHRDGAMEMRVYRVKNLTRGYRSIAHYRLITAAQSKRSSAGKAS